MDWSWIPKAIGALFELGVEVATKAGQRDAFIVACDAVLATARAKNDSDLERKHGR